MTRLLAFIIMTKNEASNLPSCLESLRGLPAEIFVIDSGSTDQTVEIAQRAGCRILEHPFANYALQFNWALDNISTEAPWIFRLDADEYLTPELRSELVTKLPQLGQNISGVLMKRRFYFMGRWMRHGGMYPIWHIRLFRRGQGRCENRWMDEHIQLSGGETVRFNYDFVDENSKNLTFWTDKHNWYALREVLDLTSAAGSHQAILAQAKRKRWAKEAMYAKAPLFVRAFAYWLARYFLLLGFLDGSEGLIFHFLQAMWYRFLVDAKIYECERAAARSKADASNVLSIR
ncbi:MAG TPA: glycosyltransferase family 2 protein [Terriglobales bacterium]|nr:glycosyltransferase family 2 protein [Terriglobales bacterium]